MKKNTDNTKNLESIINRAKKTIKELIELDPLYFGSNYAVGERIKSILLPLSIKDKNLSQNFLNKYTLSSIMRCVDLTILDKGASDLEVIEVATRAAIEHCATVCVYPEHIHLVNQVMIKHAVKDVPPIAVVGFPFVLDNNIDTTKSTIEEANQAIALGAKEIDMVLPITFRENLKDYKNHFNYIKSVVDVCHKQDVPVKVILETAYLTDYQISLASLISKIAGADWVKTSTGFAEIEKFAIGRTSEEKGATPRAVAIMRASVGETSIDDLGNAKPIGVKASGGVRNREQALLVLNAGADRIGASGGINISIESKQDSLSKSALKY